MRTSTSLLLALVLTCQTVFVVHLWVKYGLEYNDWESQSVRSKSGEDKSPDFSWENAPSLEKLSWQPCYTNRECTRLAVPLNYEEPEGRKASIALVRKKAEVPETSSFYRGPVLINPGGPGGSGVDTVRGRSGDLISTILGPQFDIVGFDPRGIARSTPRASFFYSDVQRVLFNEPSIAKYIKNNSYEDVGLALSRSKVLGKLAEDTDDGYLRYITTDHTARDMLSIVEAHGRDKLQYWGFSYGSVLGSSFAAMFPDRVERLIIDGVVDVENYYEALWNNNLIDTDKVLDAFFTGCATAGPEVCGFWAADPADIRKNLTKLYDTLAASPISVSEGDSYGILDHVAIRGAVFQSLYSPYALYPKLGKLLGDPVKYALEFQKTIERTPAFECACGSERHLFDSVGDAQAAVACNDGAVIPSDLQSTREFYDDLSAKSEWGPLWSRIHIQCAGWPNYPKKHFRGPLVGNTSHPLLLIGNTADPVTPLWAAKKISQGYKGAVVLTQDSAGHCSISGPSICTQQYVREYFLDGTLPPPGTICPVDKQPFSDAQIRVYQSSHEAQSAFLSSLSPQQLELYNAVDELSQIQVVQPPFPL